MLKISCVTIAALLVLGGCGPSEEEKMAADRSQKSEAARELVRGRLKDPSSAQFRNEKWVDLDGGVLCGEVNAKNAMGGYVGFSPFVVVPIAARPEARSGFDTADGVYLSEDSLGSFRQERYCK